MGIAQKSSTSSGTRTHNLFLRREAPYPLGHTGGSYFSPTPLSYKANRHYMKILSNYKDISILIILLIQGVKHMIVLPLHSVLLIILDQTL
jgi:hypothetical protein